jgi:deaminated glutathione amidase
MTIPDREPGTVRVAAVQMVSTARVDANLATAAELIGTAAATGAQLVALPEYFCLMGMQDTDKVGVREALGRGPIQDFLAAQARQHGLWLVGGTLPLEAPEADRVLNTTLVFDPRGERVARYDKVHLFRFSRGLESYDEAATIAPGREVSTFVVTPADGPALKVGLSVCYDLRFPELYRAMNQPDLILVPAAFTATTGKAHWETLLRARAIENLCYVLAPAQGGRHENGRATFGHSMLIDPWGVVLANRPDGPGVVFGDVDPQVIARCRSSLPALAHRVL